ncbi:MAG: HAMP domain-containing protein [Gammaproteobacteria bacterium]|nr:HAMP domain-containing protein [Gammaproteobacteria bacterium]
MLSKQSSIKAKMTLFFVGIVILLALIYSSLSITSLTSFSDQQVSVSEQQLTSSVQQAMSDAGQLASNRVTELITESFTPAINLANILKDSAHPNAPLAREVVMEMTASVLESSDTLSAMYAQFEANGYDNDDANWTNNKKHSTPVGTLEIYFVKEQGQAVLYPVDDPQEKYAATPDESGIREAEWYLCSRDNKQNCALDPYLYEIEEGNSELMTTLTAPIVVNNQFRGLVGVDINLPIVQSWLEEQAASLFSGHSEITLVSQRGLIIASSKYKDDLTKPLKNTIPSLTKALRAKDSIVQTEGSWIVRVPVNIRQANINWQLFVSVPENIAMANVIEMKENATSSLSSTIMKLAILSILLLGIAVAFALWLTRSITKPIELVSDSIKELADREGDLTQTVNVSSHQELIKLASGFNRFNNKLAEMISVSKHNVNDLSNQFTDLQHISNEVELDTGEQQSQLDNVATAVTEMAAAASEVAEIAVQTANGSSHAAELLTETQSILRESVNQVEELAQKITSSSEQVTQVATRSADITGIVVTIQSIAEQTNLLALNAAIEAARAGEQGRGFAVVADEVRNLAARTQTSTQEISSLIDNLQKDVTTTVQALEQIQSTVANTVEKTNGSFTRLSATMESVDEISQGSEQVASAAQEQSVVSEDINKRLVLVTDSSKQLADLGIQLKDKSQLSQQLVHKVQEQLNRLKV